MVTPPVATERPSESAPELVPRLPDHPVPVDEAHLLVVEGSVPLHRLQSPLDPSGGRGEAPAELVVLPHRERDEEDEGQVDRPARRERIESAEENSLPILGLA